MPDISGVTVDGRSRPVLITGSSYSQVTLDFNRYCLGIGQTYVGGLSTDDLANTPLHISFTTPSPTADRTVVQFFTLLATVYGEGQLIFTEAPTGGLTGGTAWTPYNQSRIHQAVSPGGFVDSKTGATAPTGGTVLLSDAVGSGGLTPSTGTVGDLLGENIWVLNVSTTYSVRLTGVGTDVRAVLKCRWLEYWNRP